jgi:hypothetical protein
VVTRGNRKRLGALALGSATALTACSLFVGRDLQQETGDGGTPLTASDGAIFDGPTQDTGTVGPPADGASSDGPAPTCSGANLQQDAKNCGSCGHDCGSGACAAGVCQAWTLVDGQPASSAIAIDATSIYWSSESAGQVVKAGKDGSAVTVLSFISGSSPFTLAIDDTNVYWSEDSTDAPVRRCPKTGCSGVGIAVTPATLDNTGALAVDGTNVYVAEYVVGAVGRAAKGGGGALTFVATSLGDAYGLAADDASVFFSTTSIIGAVSDTVPGAATDTDDAGPYTTLLGTVSNALGLILASDGNLYWAENNDVGGAVKWIPKGGASLANIVSANETRPLGVAVDDANVYWTAQGANSATDPDSFVYVNGYVARCPKAGCPASGPAMIATGLHNPSGIVVDDTAIYFTIFGNAGASGTITEGSVMKALK